MCAIHASSVDSGESAHLRRHSHWILYYVSKSHVLEAKAMASLYICIGSPEPRIATKYHVLVQIEIYVPFMWTANAVVSLHQQPRHVCATISKLYQCVKNASIDL